MTATLVTRFSRSTLTPDIMFNTESLICKMQTRQTVKISSALSLKTCTSQLIAKAIMLPYRFPIPNVVE